MNKKRKWEVIIWLPPKFWHFHIWKSFGGKYGSVFLREFWVGPFCFRYWTDSKSASYRWFRVIHAFYSRRW